MVIILFALLVNTNPTNNASIIADAISYIVNEYYEKEHELIYKKVVLFSNHPYANIELILEQINKQLPELDITYQPFNPAKNQCTLVDGELGIVIPDSLWTTSTGTFQCEFQSVAENIFGTLTFEITVEDNSIALDKIELFSTSIGYPPR